MRQGFWTTLTYSLGYLVLALLCVIQWRGPDPWLRLDVFAGGYLGLRLLGTMHSLCSSHDAFRSKPRRREWWGQNSDPGWTKWVKLLMAADLTVFLDYGHWHIVPALAQPTLQAAGLALYAAVAFWQTWTDSRLAKFFSDTQTDFVNSGPYRYIRHPRYAAAMAGKIAMALVLASCLGWLLFAVWTILLLHQIGLEEIHLRNVFGAKYEVYAEQTARILPGIY